MSDTQNDQPLANDEQVESRLQTRKIAHAKFTLPVPYSEGHTCTAEEATALNDAYARRVSQMVSEDLSNISTKVEATAEAEAYVNWSEGWSQERAQKEIVDAYVSEFSWSADRTRDPVETEIFRLARVAVEDKMAKAQITLDRSAKNKKVREVVDANYEKLKKIAVKNINTPLVEVNLAA